MPEKILCIQLKRIGDVLMTTPAIRTLYQKIPKVEIHFITESPCNQIYKYNPYITKIIQVPSKPKTREAISLIKSLRKEKYSAVIDFQGQPNTALMSRLTGARKRVGFDLRARSLFYTHPIDTPQGVDYSALQKLFLLTALGVSSNDAKLDFYISEEDRNNAKQILKGIRISNKYPIVSISPVSRRDYKVWPAEYFARVADYIAETYSAQILFLWGPGEYHFVKKVKDLMKRSSLPRYEIPTLAETVGILEMVDLHIGNDNGPMHFAIAAGTPTVAVFGRPLLRNWTPPNVGQHLALEFDPGCKEQCHYPNCKLECLTGLSPENVIEKINTQMSRFN